MHLILTGATGLVGGACLRAMLTRPDVTKVSILSRRAVPQAEGQSKCEVLIHPDFTQYDASLMKKLEGANGCVWALGISQFRVSKSDYLKITQDYPLAFAEALSTQPNRCNFLYVSGEGATHNPGSFTPFFARVKGEIEQELLALSATTNGRVPVYVVRPGGVDAGAQPEIAPFVPKAAGLEVFWRTPALSATKMLYPSGHTPTKEMGEVMVKVAGGDGEPLEGKGVEGKGRIVTNVGLRAMAGL